MAENDTYAVACHTCKGSFDALKAPWCTCLTGEPSLVCPSCGNCFCKAPSAYRQHFWRDAPKTMWARKSANLSERPPVPENPSPAKAKRPLVLLVDDEPNIQRVAGLALSALGYDMVLAGNGEEGLEFARRYKPDLVLSDALMPKMDGREMCRRLKEDPETAAIKVVIMTSLYTNIKYQNEAYKSFKVDDYLIKPLEFDQLRSLLHKHLG